MKDLQSAIKSILDFNLTDIYQNPQISPQNFQGVLEIENLIQVLNHFSESITTIQIENIQTINLSKAILQIKNVSELFKENYKKFNPDLNYWIYNVISISFKELKLIIKNLSELLENNLVQNDLIPKLTNRLSEMLVKVAEVIKNSAVEKSNLNSIIDTLKNITSTFINPNQNQQPKQARAAQDIFSLLPEDVRNFIFKNLLEFEDRKVARLMSKSWLGHWENWMQNNHQWEKRFKEEFPHDYENLLEKYQQDSNSNNSNDISQKINWRKEYEKAFIKNYKDLSVDKIRIIRIVKAGDLAALKKEKINFEMLGWCDYNAYTLIDWATLKGHAHILAYFYQTVENVDNFWPVSLGQIEIVKTYSNPETIKNDSQATLLHQAAWYSQLEIVKYLISKKADVNATDDENNQPLHHAAIKGYDEVVKFLLEHGANVDGNNMETPLKNAILYNHVKVVRLLLNYKANVNLICGKAGFSPLHLAVTMEDSEDSLKIVKLLLNYKADVNVVSKNGNTPLHLASRHGHLEVVKLLLKKGAMTDAENKQGKSPLFFAARYNQIEVVKLLLAQGAKIKQGWTIPFSISVKIGKTTYSSSFTKEIVKLLNFEGKFREIMELIKKTLPGKSSLSNFLSSPFKSDKWKALDEKLQAFKLSDPKYFENRLVMFFQNPKDWLALDNAMFQRFCGILLKFTKENSQVFQLAKAELDKSQNSNSERANNNENDYERYSKS